MVYTVDLIEDPETQELILPLPPELLESLGWKEGDKLQWNQVNGGFVITKKE